MKSTLNGPENIARLLILLLGLLFIPGESGFFPAGIRLDEVHFYRSLNAVFLSPLIPSLFHPFFPVLSIASGLGEAAAGRLILVLFFLFLLPRRNNARQAFLFALSLACGEAGLALFHFQIAGLFLRKFDWRPPALPFLLVLHPPACLLYLRSIPSRISVLGIFLIVSLIPGNFSGTLPDLLGWLFAPLPSAAIPLLLVTLSGPHRIAGARSEVLLMWPMAACATVAKFFPAIGLLPLFFPAAIRIFILIKDRSQFRPFHLILPAMLVLASVRLPPSYSSGEKLTLIDCSSGETAILSPSDLSRVRWSGKCTVHILDLYRLRKIPSETPIILKHRKQFLNAEEDRASRLIGTLKKGDIAVIRRGNTEGSRAEALFSQPGLRLIML